MDGGKVTRAAKILAATAFGAIALVGTSADAMAAGVMGGADSPAHAGVLLLTAWLLSSLRARKKNGRWRFGFELSPVRRVRALSTVRRARTSGPVER